jgi:hypothetical protein
MWAVLVIVGSALSLAWWVSTILEDPWHNGFQSTYPSHAKTPRALRECVALTH